MPPFTRRNFLQGCSSAIAALAGARLTNLSFVQQDNPTDTLVVVFLRGGWDALNVVPPIDGDDRGFDPKAFASLGGIIHSAAVDVMGAIRGDNGVFGVVACVDDIILSG